MDRFANPSDTSPAQWITWSNLLAKYGLFSPRPSAACAFLFRDLEDKATHQTQALAEFRRGQLEHLVRKPEAIPLGRALAGRSGRIGDRGIFSVNTNTDIRINNNSLIRAPSGKTIENSGPPRRINRTSKDPALPANPPPPPTWDPRSAYAP